MHFKLAAHRNVLTLLQAFDSEKLARCQFLFGGGTRIVLQLDEYRESRGFYFLCSDREGYSELRADVSMGYAAFFKPDALGQLRFPHEMRIDQHGIRISVEVEGETISVELIREARIDLDPGVRPEWCPVDCLSLTDCQAEKLLANSDRWADRQALSRDLIDLSALRSRCGPFPEAAWDKAEKAYRSTIKDDLSKALAAFAGDDSHQRRCFEGLQIDRPEEILDGLSRLRADLAQMQS
ncbi:MAG TPA: nucleotidyl transferase AbiEii/AbiGii toxin family protein [Thermoanaerobaculia bacterium]|nr:nucleotidyl transferase AbiEii/AbiGii toxin family protein [Thermoanaerobaculia bacterium]